MGEERGVGGLSMDKQVTKAIQEEEEEWECWDGQEVRGEHTWPSQLLERQ